VVEQYHQMVKGWWNEHNLRGFKPPFTRSWFYLEAMHSRFLTEVVTYSYMYLLSMKSIKN